jgi:hypothetical protein
MQGWVWIRTPTAARWKRSPPWAWRNLAIGDIPVEFVATPIMIVTMAVVLASQIALLRQIGQHLRQLHLPLPRQARVALWYIGPFATLVASVRTTRSAALPWRAGVAFSAGSGAAWAGSWHFGSALPGAVFSAGSGAAWAGVS